MNSNQTITAVPLHVVLRRRREELNLSQTQIAEALNVNASCVTLWEGGRRRMELSKLPRIAKALQLDAEELCRKALAEFHPPVFEALFGKTIAHSVISTRDDTHPRTDLVGHETYSS
jgi:transcriptional regulator with XRE-family HTH domain